MTKIGWVAVLAVVGQLALAQPPMRRQVTAAQEQVHGDATRGEAIVAGKGGCLACHRVADRGSHMGPDLSAIANTRSVAQLQKAMLEPSAEVSASYQMYKVTTKAGKSYSGRLMNQDRTGIQLLDTDDRLRSFLKDDLASYDFAPTPPMPSYRERLTAAEQDDVIAYLATLRGIVKQ